jgi:hypothetical protein
MEVVERQAVMDHTTEVTQCNIEEYRDIDFGSTFLGAPAQLRNPTWIPFLESISMANIYDRVGLLHYQMTIIQNILGLWRLSLKGKMDSIEEEKKILIVHIIKVTEVYNLLKGDNDQIRTDRQDIQKL